MGLIREPDDINLNIQSKPLTREEEERLSQFIKERKQEIEKKKHFAQQKLYGSRAARRN
ncbi:hypothetical protein [Adhaeribacter arboris]|uniref:hypothetical protein n=1 Tax=Adhaeribacter arboris TaxID=2072846 RepID=UPI001304ED3A|nr:hypothetical protein [Adhaeribacter arboris]